MKPWQRFLWVFVVTITMVMMPVAANAFQLLECMDHGTVKAGTTLFDADPDKDPQTKSGECQYMDQPVIEHVFSYVICDFVVILNDIMDAMYCGMNYYLVNVVAVLLTLYLTVYGAEILMGVAQLSTRDALVRLLKISFIYVFSTQSAYGIHFIFQFFLGVISSTSSAVLNTLGNEVAAQSDGVCSFAGVDTYNMMSMYNFMDYLVCHALFGPAAQANTRVQGLFLSMAFTLPPMYLMFQWWVITTIKTLVITLVTFLKSLAAIAFLTTLSPFFLGFFLFQSTAYVFENWLRYLISYAIQVCLVMAIIVAWILTINQFIGFFNELSKLIFPYVPVEVMGADFRPPNDWAICSPIYGTDKTTGAPTAVCEKGFDANPPVCTGTPPAVSCQPPVNPGWEADNHNLLQPSEIINQGEFLYYIFFHIGGLLLVSYSFSLILAQADRLAKNLAGPQSVPSLTPGFGAGLGSAGGFKAPALVGSSATDDQPATRMAAGFHDMVTGR